MDDMNRYQRQTADTAFYLANGMPPIPYLPLKLAGEAGEVAEKFGKLYRNGWQGHISYLSEEEKRDLALELGDVLWYLARLADELGFKLSEIAIANLEKLQSRKARGTILGSGDHR